MKAERIYSIIGLISSILSLIFLPIVFGPIAIILGYIARKKGDKNFGLVVITLGITLMIISILLGIFFSMFGQIFGKSAVLA